jgi:serine/threonine-protein kinase
MKLTPSGLIKLVDFGLVKLLAPGEVTITVMQGQGTALYTPIEQYGGDSGHTDVQSDIFAFGATLYHLLTNTPPINARERFLSPESLLGPRQINADISPRTERAILWAMSLHPNERPPNVEAFRQALIGDRVPPTRPAPYKPTLRTTLQSYPERTLLFVSAGLAAIGLIASLLH